MIPHRQPPLRQFVAGTVFPAGFHPGVFDHLARFAGKPVTRAADFERGGVGENVSGGPEGVHVQFSRRRHRRVGVAGGEQQPVERPRQFAEQRIRAVFRVDVMDSEQRRLHAARRNPERLEEQRPDPERHRTHHQQQVKPPPDGLVTVRRHRLAEPRFELSVTPVRVGGWNRFHFGQQRVELRLRVAAQEIVVVAAAEPDFAPQFGQFLLRPVFLPERHDLESFSCR
ncbi:hypothetical protein SDC9_175378 [bioreactor metagenome]|uniref:Uncharacterized protein n=1 Tax=bioreactor metagenome TaxID=1076179 RepID=A0A645GV86_9ZZZZ